MTSCMCVNPLCHGGLSENKGQITFWNDSNYNVWPFAVFPDSHVERIYNELDQVWQLSLILDCKSWSNRYCKIPYCSHPLSSSDLCKCPIFNLQLGFSPEDSLDVKQVCQFDQYHYHGTQAVAEAARKLGIKWVQAPLYRNLCSENQIIHAELSKYLILRVTPKSADHRDSGRLTWVKLMIWCLLAGTKTALTWPWPISSQITCISQRPLLWSHLQMNGLLWL